ncbi:MAG: hemerythrin family protein [Bacteroidales bacterium]|nr:hemerythrin family protein [Bacteroidales bacterium]
MAHLFWNESLRVEDPGIDQQNKQIIGLLNMFCESVKQDEGKIYVYDLLNLLKEYSKYHFLTEETEMKKNGYIHLSEHKKKHTLYMKKLLELEKSVSNEKKEKTLKRTEELKTWYFSHIKEHDQKFFRQEY